MCRPQYAFVGVLALAACSLDLKIPSNTLVSCPDGRCPDGYTCNNTQLCVPSSSNDTTAPTLSDASYDRTAVAKSKTVNLTFTVSEPLLVDPVVKFTSNSIERTFTRVSAGTGDTPVYVFAYTTAGDEQEGTQQVTTDLTDLAGNSNTVNMPTFVIDFTPPQLVPGSASLVLTPNAATSPISAVTTITNGTHVQLTFRVTEPLVAAPVLSFSGTTLATAQVSDTVFTLDVVWSAGTLADGAYSVVATLIDLATNSTDAPLPLASTTTPHGFVVDTTAPPLPLVGTAGAITLQRAPWATLTTTTPAIDVVGAAGSVEANANVVVYGTPTIPACQSSGCYFASNAIAVGEADATGAFDVSLGVTDRERVYIAVADGAGNITDVDATATGLQASLVGDESLTIAFGAPLGVANPHNVALTSTFSALPGDMTTSPVDARGITAIDSNSVTTSGGYVWTTRSMLQQQPPHVVSIVAAAASHPRLGQLLVVANTMFFQDTGPLSSLPTTPVPTIGSGSTSAAMAYDIANDALMFYGGADPSSGGRASSSTWLWSGLGWRRVCTAGDCTTTSPSSRTGFTLVADPNRRVVVLFGGSVSSLTAVDDPSWVWEWDGAHWSAHCTDSSCTSPTINDYPAAAFDPHLNEVVTFTSNISTATATSQTWSWNGTRWQQLCMSCSTNPPSRYGASMTYDKSRDRLVLYGGGSGACTSTFYNDTWLWDGAQWTNAGFTSSVGSADSRTMVYDPRRERLSLFGGVQQTCASFPAPEPDAWYDLDGTTWSKIRTLIQPLISNAAFDSGSQSLYAVGIDATSTRFDARWSGYEWNGSPFTNSFANTTASVPMVRSGYGASSNVIAYDGSTTYILTGGGWTAICTSATCGLPTGLTGYSLVSDGTHALLVGGQNASAVANNSIYKFVGPGWSLVCATCGGQKVGSTMAYAGQSGQFFSLTGSASPIGGGELQILGAAGSFVDLGALPAGQPLVYSTAVYDSSRRGLSWLGGGQPGSHGSLVPRQPFQYFTGSTTTAYSDPTTVWAVPPPSIASEAPPSFVTQQLQRMFAGFDDKRATAVLVSGDDSGIWTMNGSGDRPAHVVTLVLTDAMLFATASLATLDIDWYGTATSDVGGSPSSAITIWAWNYDRWSDIGAVNVSGDHWHALLTPSALGPGGRLERLAVGQSATVTLAVTPAGINGTLASLASIATDAVSASMTYHIHD